MRERASEPRWRERMRSHAAVRRCCGPFVVIRYGLHQFGIQHKRPQDETRGRSRPAQLEGLCVFHAFPTAVPAAGGRPCECCRTDAGACDAWASREGVAVQDCVCMYVHMFVCVCVCVCLCVCVCVCIHIYAGGNGGATK